MKNLNLFLFVTVLSAQGVNANLGQPNLIDSKNLFLVLLYENNDLEIRHCMEPGLQDHIANMNSPCKDIFFVEYQAPSSLKKISIEAYRAQCNRQYKQLTGNPLVIDDETNKWNSLSLIRTFLATGLVENYYACQNHLFYILKMNKQKACRFLELCQKTLYDQFYEE